MVRLAPMRIGLGAVLLLSLGFGCNRSDEARSSRDAQAPAADGEPSVQAARTAAPITEPDAPTTRTDAPSAPATPHCVVPTPDESPKPAEPAKTCPKSTGPELSFGHGYVEFVDAPGAPRITVEVARDAAEHERGLMFRTRMPEEEGMLFRWAADAPRTFWMHNTCIPLDMLFIAADGVIEGILEQVPVLNDDPRAVPCPARYVLEVNAGFCRRHSVKAGMRVRIE